MGGLSGEGEAGLNTPANILENGDQAPPLYLVTTGT